MCFCQVSKSCILLVNGHHLHYYIETYSSEYYDGMQLGDKDFLIVPKELKLIHIEVPRLLSHKNWRSLP